MPDGLDPHRDKWVPVPLTLNEYDAEKKTYVIEFTAPKQLLMHGEFEAMVHDELLRNADRKGLVVEGQIMVTTRDKGTEYTVAEDDTLDRDKTVQDVLLHPEKEADVQAEQDALESPYKMSAAEKAYRARMRQNLRDTGLEALGFVQRELDDKPIPGSDEKFKVDPKAFLEGFHGVSSERPMTKTDFMTVRAEALIAMDLGLSGGEPGADLPVVDPEMLNIEIPDDISELDTDE